MPWRSRAFWLPRKGNGPTEYEDACAADDATGRYALADGASDGCFTGLWARLLVEDFVHGSNCLAAEWPVSLSGPQRQWDADVHREALPWHAEAGVSEGAHAAFLGLSLTDSSRSLGEGSEGTATCRWQAVAVGDSCLFHTRDRSLLRAFPLQKSRQFTNVPKLVGAKMSLEQIHKKRRLWTDGRGRGGDRLWAATDSGR